MGADPLAVVDRELRVHGIDGPGVADASIMPALTSGNINVPGIMIGEKCAEMVPAAAVKPERRAALVGTRAPVASLPPAFRNSSAAAWREERESTGRS